MTIEKEKVSMNLIGHLKKMVHWGRKLTPEQFDFTFDQAAPTPRTLFIHTWQWLICDRYHIEQADAALHPRVPDPPADPAALCDALAEETERWRVMLEGFTDDDLAQKRYQFNETQWDWSVRGSVYHMLQNVLYKHGQLSYLVFALGYDGTEPYTAPFPNPIYAEIFGESWPRTA